MASAGFASLIIAFAASSGTVACMAGGIRSKRDGLLRLGRALALATVLFLLACCAILVVGFVTGDVSMLYVLQNRSLSNDGFAWLYVLSGLWAGRAGSLLFWAFLIALFGTLIVLRGHMKRHGPDSTENNALDDIALLTVFAVTVVFCGILLFTEGNMPFVQTPDRFFAADGSLTTAAEQYSMNPLLEHWAMAIHPPLLFIGYAGLTVPFAYAVAALAKGDSSTAWVDRSLRFTLASWLFLSAGIGLGAVWAYVVLGWGGYWGWDPVENASLLSWLVCVALMHSFAAYKQRGIFKRWAIMCASLAFTSVIVATFITRSGIVQSVHAFAGDPISLVLFGGLIGLSLVIPIAGIIMRWKSFGTSDEDDDIENLLSKDGAYYLNNIVMILFAFMLTYMTLAPALPSWLPFGGDSLGTSSYEALARPLGILYLLVLAICPLLSWTKTDPRAFLKRARIPGLCAIVLFVILLIFWTLKLLPIYEATMAQGNAASLELAEAGPAWYYNGLAVLGLLVASLLFFNAAYMLTRSARLPQKRGSAIGGSIAHLAMAVILIGLIGSNMYAAERSGYMGFDMEGGHATETFRILNYEIVYTGDALVGDSEGSGGMLFQVDFDVYENGQVIGHVQPSLQIDGVTQQQKLNAGVLNLPGEDVFVVFRGTNQQGALSLDARVNPLISFVWIGFALLLLGMVCGLVMPGKPRRLANLGKASADERD